MTSFRRCDSPEHRRKEAVNCRQGQGVIDGGIRRRRNMKESCVVMILVGCVLLFGCSGPAITLLIPGADRIELSESSPPDGYDMMGFIRGADGEGCGIFGYSGTYERASINIRNTARSIKADYVQITGVLEPHVELFCYDNNYVLYGMAYKRTIQSPVSDERSISHLDPRP